MKPIRISKFDGITYRDPLLQCGEIDGWKVAVWKNEAGEPYATAFDDCNREHHLEVDTPRWSGCTCDWFGIHPKHKFPLLALRRLAKHGWLRVEHTIQLPGGSSLGSTLI